MEKIKNYLKKSMFERSNGVDIDKLSTSELLRQVKLIPVLFIIAIVCAVLIIGFGVVIAGVLVADGEFEGALWTLLCVALGVPSAFVAFILPKRLDNVKKTLDSREIDTKIQEIANQKLAETKKYSIIGLIALVIVIVSFVAVFVIGGFSTSFNSSDDECINCGREKKLVAAYDLCYDCFEGYLEWEERKNNAD